MNSEYLYALNADDLVYKKIREQMKKYLVLSIIISIIFLLANLTPKLIIKLIGDNPYVFITILLILFFINIYIFTLYDIIKKNKKYSILLSQGIAIFLPIIFVLIITFFYDGMTTAKSNPDSSLFLWYCYFLIFILPIGIILYIINFYLFSFIEDFINKKNNCA